MTEVRAVVGDVLPQSPAAAAGLTRGDEIARLRWRAGCAASPMWCIGLLEQMTDGRRGASWCCDPAAGEQRNAVLSVADPVERRRLTEPENLLRGLGFGFWRPPVPAIDRPAGGGWSCSAGRAGSGR